MIKCCQSYIIPLDKLYSSIFVNCFLNDLDNESSIKHHKPCRVCLNGCDNDWLNEYETIIK